MAKQLQLRLTAICSTANNGTRKMDLLNCSLPVRQESMIATILEKNDLPFSVPASNDDSYRYNCWGYVAFNFGWENDAKWISSRDMEEHLSLHTEPISESEATMGDIAVFRYTTGQLQHTALVTYDLNIICHKPGAQSLCVDSMERATAMYGNNVTYARPLR